MSALEIINNPEHLNLFLTDGSGLEGGYLDGVVHPASTEEVSRVLSWASDESRPITVSGARTGLAGGAIPNGGIVLSTDRLIHIADVDLAQKSVRAEAGVRLADLHSAASSHGCFYPPDPTETLATVGGNLATNASGARTFRYGATRQWVESIVVVLADGEILSLRRGDQVAEGDRLQLTTDRGARLTLFLPAYTPPSTTKNATGFFLRPGMDAVDLFIGSEGTLGVITEAEFRLLPEPAVTFSGLVFFANEADLADAVEDIRQRSRTTSPTLSDQTLSARAIEFIDSDALEALRHLYPELPTQTGGALWIEQEGDDLAMIEEWSKLLESHHALLDASFFGLDEGHHRRLRTIRHAVPTQAHEILHRRGVRKFGTDMAVPEDRFRELFNFYRRELRSAGIESMIWGHIGNAHLHVNLLPQDRSGEEGAKQLYGRFVEKALALGGTVSAEHGIGKAKREYLLKQLGEDVVEGMRDIKRTLDPAGILGKGTLFIDDSSEEKSS